MIYRENVNKGAYVLTPVVQGYTVAHVSLAQSRRYHQLIQSEGHDLRHTR